MKQNQIKLLLVDDNEDDYLLTRNLISEIEGYKYNIEWVNSFNAALENMTGNNHDVCLLDYGIDNRTGFDLMMKAFEGGCKLPVIMLAEEGDQEMDVKALESGASDYLIKGTIDKAALERSIRYAIERKKTEEKIMSLAYYDQLTKLPNRISFNDRLKNVLVNANRYERVGAVLFLDLDNFKKVNDSLGHRIGDLLLMEVSIRLISCIRKSDIIARNNVSKLIDINKLIDIIARLGGDEFTICLTEIRSDEDASRVAQRIIDELSSPFSIEGHDIYISASIGISIFPSDGDNIEILLKHADTAMYQAKAKGKNNFQYFNKSMNEIALKKLTLENDLRKALERKEFHLNYQPKMNIKTGRLIGMEALMRWQHPDKGFISPMEFIPVAEENNLIIPIGEIAIKEACLQYSEWQKSGLKPVPISVNLSIKQFMQKDIVKNITSYLSMYNMPPEFLEFEIKEMTFVEDSKSTIHRLNELKELGIRISIDNFGVGFSSFGTLKEVQLHSLKIDRSFISNIDTNPADATIVKAIISMGHSLGVDIVAEGVETIDQLILLHLMKCDVMQGFLLSKPLPKESIPEILNGENNGKGIGMELYRKNDFAAE